jgi:hypothetical protein
MADDLSLDKTDIELASASVSFQQYPERESTFAAESSFTSAEDLENKDTADEEEAAKKTMTLECPVLPCWDETDDGVPPVCG